MKFLLSSKNTASSIVVDSDKTEEFLLTIGLAYRDMATIHVGRDTTDPRPEPPEYMKIHNTLLSQRVMDVCDSVLTFISKEMKKHKEKSTQVVTPATVRGRKVAAESFDSPRSDLGDGSDQDMNTTGPNKRKVQDDAMPIILPRPRPRPRKRQRAKSIGEFEEEEVRLSIILTHIVWAHTDSICRHSS